MRTAALEVLGYSYLDMGKYDEAQKYLFPIYQNGTGTTDDSIYYGMAVYWSGDRESGRNILKSVSNGGTLRKNAVLAADYAYQGDYKKAYEEKAYIDTLLTPIIKKSFNNTITSNLDSYYSLERHLNRVALERSRLKMVLILLIACGILTGIIMVAISRHRRQQRELNKKLEIAEDLQEALERTKYNYTQIISKYENLQKYREKLKTDYDNMQLNCRQLQSAYEEIQENYEKVRIEAENAQASNILALNLHEEDKRTLIKGRFEMLDILTDLVTQNRNRKGGRQKIADSISNLISEFSDNEEKIKELEEIIDTTFENLMTDFRRDFEGRKQADYKLFLFSVIGLSNSTIAEFLKEDCIESVYSRRKRLKRIIKMAPEEIRNRYLQYL